MIRAPLLAAALAIGLAVPAFAADTQANAAGQIFTRDNARQHLLHLGYTNVSELQRDSNGNWAGTALKDGKTVPVAVGVKGPATTSTN
jgi:hypothetical protein